MQTTGVRCGNPDCGRFLDESSALTPSEREPCPNCGSLARVFEKSGTAAVGTLASLAWAKTHEEIQRHWPWYLLGVALTVASAVVGYLIGGLVGLLVGLAMGLVAVPVGERSVTRVREIERGGSSR